MSGKVQYLFLLTFFLVAIVSKSDSDPPSPRSTKLMALLAKQMDKLQRNVERGMGERFNDIQRSTQELSGRMEDIERRRHHRSPYSSQGSDDGYEEGRRHRHRRNMDGME